MVSGHRFVRHQVPADARSPTRSDRRTLSSTRVRIDAHPTAATESTVFCLGASDRRPAAHHPTDVTSERGADRTRRRRLFKRVGSNWPPLRRTSPSVGPRHSVAAPLRVRAKTPTHREATRRFHSGVTEMERMTSKKTTGRTWAFLVGILLLAGPAQAFPTGDVAAQVAQVKAAVQTKAQGAQALASNLFSSFSKSTQDDPEAATIPITKKMSDFIENILVNVLKPKPIIDSIREEDKYGNDGEKFNKVGRSVVGGVETLTTFIASAADFPVNTLKSITRQATAALNKLGSKIVGLS